jgi:hypothetical protein
MKLSFIAPRSKPFFQKDTKFWMILIFSTFFILGSLSGSLIWKTYQIKDSVETIIVARKDFVIKADDAKNEYLVLKEDVTYGKTIQTTNQLLIGSLMNLFEIVPDAVVLEKVELTDQCLTLMGYTPTKELYNLQLAPALKSVFSRSEASFIPRGPGKIQFISVSTLANSALDQPAEEAHGKH